MRKLLKFFVIFATVALCLGGGRIAFSSDADGCAEFTRNTVGNCEIKYEIPRVAVGGGWTSYLTGGNLGTSATRGEIQFQWRLDNGQKVVFKDNRVNDGAEQIEFGESYPLPIDQSVEVNFLRSTDDQPMSCSMSVKYQAWYPEYLRGLPRPSVRFSSNSGFQAFEPVLDPASKWRSPVAVDIENNELYAFSFTNPNATAVTIKGTLIDNNGNVVGVQNWTINPKEDRAMYLNGSKGGINAGFGQEPFLGKRFTGWLVLEADGNIVPFAIQQKGTGMSNTDIQPF
jgi:hypothetical protein